MINYTQTHQGNDYFELASSSKETEYSINPLNSKDGGLLRLSVERELTEKQK